MGTIKSMLLAFVETSLSIRTRRPRAMNIDWDRRRRLRAMTGLSYWVDLPLSWSVLIKAIISVNVVRLNCSGPDVLSKFKLLNLFMFSYLKLHDNIVIKTKINQNLFKQPTDHSGWIFQTGSTAQVETTPLIQAHISATSISLSLLSLTTRARLAMARVLLISRSTSTYSWCTYLVSTAELMFVGLFIMAISISFVLRPELSIFQR